VLATMHSEHVSNSVCWGRPLLDGPGWDLWACQRGKGVMLKWQRVDSLGQQQVLGVRLRR